MAAGWVALIVPSFFKALSFFELWHTVEFLLDKLKHLSPLAEASLRELSANWLVIVGGGAVWIIVSLLGAERRPAARLNSTALESVVVHDQLKQLLETHVRQGRAIASSPTTLLASQWVGRTQALLRAAVGETEARVFAGDDEIAPRPTLAEWIASRCDRLENLMHRLPYTYVRADFRPAQWRH